jgi:hypothetical protein
LKTRYAELKDLAEVLELTWRGYKELESIAPVKYKPDLLYKEVILPSWRRAPCVLLEKENQIIGMWGLTTYRVHGSTDSILADYMFYIIPEHRSLKAVEALKKAVISVADQFNLNMKLSYLFTDKKDAHIKLFEKVGFKVTGVLGTYEGNKDVK